MTIAAAERARCIALAAMEPVQIGRDDPTTRATTSLVFTAAMEPVQIGRDDAMKALGIRLAMWLPQWSPSRSDGMTGTGAAMRRMRSGRRNGARPDRTG